VWWVKFGCKEERSWPVTFGQNEKAGMDEVEFEKYLLNFIVPLYPDAKNMLGHRVLLKVDSGPGRMNIRLLTKLRRLGFILYPCVPNTTHVTQETDRCYGPFKTQFAINLDNLVDARLKKDKSVSLQPKLVGLPVFGGYDAQSEFNIEVSAFQRGFNRDMCVLAWEKVGAATKNGITRRCLEDKTVNDLAVHALVQAGYDGKLLRATIKEDKHNEAEKIITEPNTAACVAALVNAKMHGARFHATHGTH